MKIKEISHKLNLPISTLHYYERIGLLTPKRGDNNYRYYTEEDLNHLLLISVMKKFNFSIQEIKEVMHRYTVENTSNETTKEAQAFFEKKVHELQKKIREFEDVIAIINNLPILSDNPLEWQEKKNHTLEMAKNLYKKL